MTPPTVRVNTFVNEYDKIHVDFISKIFILLQIMFGLNGMPLIGKRKCMFRSLPVLISLLLHGTVIFLFVIDSHRAPTTLIMTITIIRNIISTVLSYCRYKWIERFYKELNEFDKITGCRPKVSKSTICNVVYACLLCVFVLFLNIDQILRSQRIFMLPFHIVYCLEVYYMGHLLTLITPRLMLINYYNESSLSSSTPEANYIQKEFVYLKCYDANIDQCQIHRLMELYQILVEAFDFLVDGIKWQLLLVLVSSFAKILGFLYVFTLSIIRDGEVMFDTTIGKIGTTVVATLPLFAPCIFCDSLHNEVKKSRELLASRLYENKLDKSGRRTARAFLAFTETRDLSFRLLRMLSIDISLPFKFIGLLVTYLIILLQFNKVINP